MNYKVFLAELAGKEDLSVNEFCRLDAYKKLEKDPDFIELIEMYHLPEVNRLICTSDKLAYMPWAKWYNVIKEIIINENNINSDEMAKAVNHVLEICEKGNCFDKIIALEDDTLNGSLTMYFEKLKSGRNKYYKELNIICNEINKRARVEEGKELDKQKIERKNNPSNNPNSKVDKRDDNTIYVKKSDDELKDLRDKYQDNVSFYDEQLSKYDEYIKSLDKITHAKIDYDTRRYEVYEIAKGIAVPDVASFIREYTKTSRIPQEYNVLLERKDFILEIYGYLKMRPEMACTVISHLVKDKAIDPSSKEYTKFLKGMDNHWICGYLFDEYKERKNIYASKIDISLWDIVIEKEIKSNKIIFNDLWAIVSDERSWEYIINKVAKYNFSHEFIKFMSEDNPHSPEIIAGIISNHDNPIISNSLWTICEELVDRQIKHNFVLAMLSEIKKINMKKSQMLIMAQAENMRFVQNLFGEIYEPIEKLEIFRYNLNKGNITYSKYLVQEEIADFIIGLRNGLSSMGLSSLEDVTAWHKGVGIKFNQNKHSLDIKTNEQNNKVLLKTLGFSYKNEEGEIVIHKAEVSSDNSRVGVAETRCQTTARTRNSSRSSRRSASKRMDINNGNNGDNDTKIEH